MQRYNPGMSWLTRDQWPLLLIWSCLVVLPIGRVVEVPVMLMAIAGIYLLFKHWRTWRNLPAFRLFGTVFLLAWIPILVSLVDAVRVESTATMTVNHLRFGFGGLFILHVLSTPRAQQRFLALCAWVLLFWVVDGMVQVSFGRDLFGFAPPETMPGVERLNALFGREGLVYATVLTVFCPLLWEHARRHWARWQLVAVVFATVLIVLLSGTRSAWISIGVLLLAYGILFSIRYRRLSLHLSAAAIVAVTVTVTALWFGSEQFAGRLNTAVGAFTDSADAVSDAIGHRYWIARGAVNMIRANAVNGVGAGGFRYAFPDYAAADDPYFNAGPAFSPSHSHHLWLEILSESGIIGAAGLATLLLLLVMAGVRAPAHVQRCMLPYALCLLVAYFPVNSHMAIYSSFWSQILWWLIALYCAAYGAGLASAANQDGAAK
jgi:O-antigen ligase